jgi:hypothetical protein
LAISRAGESIKELAEENRQAIKELAEENKKGLAEMRQEIAARDAVTDKRISDLVIAIGDLIQRMDGKDK